MKVFDLEDNIKCFLGETAKENWDLLDKSKKHNMFFHLSSFPSGYVITDYEGVISNEILIKASKICKDNSKYKNLRNIKIDYCMCGNLIKGNEVGIVYYKSLRVVKQIKL